MNTCLAERVVKLVNALMDGWKDRSMKKKSKLVAVDYYFSLRIGEGMPILPRISNKKKLFFIQWRADQSTIFDFSYYEYKRQGIDVKENNKSLKHVKEIWTVLLYRWLLVPLKKKSD
jgi:hypothetical protein